MEIIMSKVYWSWRNISGSLKRIWQNLTKGWNDSDLWSLDHTIAEFMIPRLKRLQEIVHGHPCFDVDPCNPTEEEQHADGMKKWKEIIGKMIYAFEGVAFRLDAIEIKDAGGKLKFITKEPTPNPLSTILRSDPSDKEDYKYSTLEYVGTEEQKKLHEQYIEEYRKACDEENKKIQEGIELFAKYYQNLWD
jgi:hypothetical protein